MLGDGQRPSTSLATDGRGMVKEWVISHEYLDNMKNRFELITQRFQKTLQPLNAVSDYILRWEPINRRLENVRDGWKRVKNIYYQDNPHSFEWEVLSKTFYTCFVTGVIIGGTDTVKKSIDRFELYRAGKEFGTVGHLMQRKMDFVMTQFYMKGAIKGFKLAAYMCSIVFITVGITCYRDRYSILYVPITTTSVFSFFAFIRGVGINGLAVAFFLSLMPSFLLTTATIGASFYYKCSIDEVYKKLRQKYLIDAKKEIDDDNELLRYTLSKGRKPGFKPWDRYKMNLDKDMNEFKRKITLNDEEELLKFGGKDEE
ncbi:unnamed protein product [Meloidogyne enterolobii]|uniref:Uncharacterized protein n=1 Tax=Meloidogyne enterolobii TaxID=390850 RepID=A0ACB0YWK5_MELEN